MYDGSGSGDRGDRGDSGDSGGSSDSDSENTSAARCNHSDGCRTIPSYGLPGDKAVRCLIHKGRGMTRKRASTTTTRVRDGGGCIKRSCLAKRRGRGEGGSCAARHKESGAFIKRCDHASGCSKRPSFGLPEGTAVRCAPHKESYMVKKYAARCDHPDGCSTIPSFGLPGGKKKVARCAKHKEPGMVRTHASRCDHPIGCVTRPSFAFPGAHAVRCYVHQEPGMVNKYATRCNHSDECSAYSRYGLPGGEVARCADHKEPGMVLLRAMRPRKLNIVGGRSEEQQEQEPQLKSEEGGQGGAYAALSALPFDADELETLRTRWLRPFAAARPTEFVTRLGTSRSATAMMSVQSRLWRIHRALWERMTIDGSDLRVAWAPSTDLLFWLRCIDRHTAACHIHPTLPSVLLTVFGLTAPPSSNNEVVEVIDLSAADAEVIDVETYVLDLVMTKIVKAEDVSVRVVDVKYIGRC